jgi:hypothetical protein
MQVVDIIGFRCFKTFGVLEIDNFAIGVLGFDDFGIDILGYHRLVYNVKNCFHNCFLLYMYVVNLLFDTHSKFKMTQVLLSYFTTCLNLKVS